MRPILSLALALAATLGCARGTPPSLERLDEAARAVESGSTDGDDLALAAWQAWLARSDGDALGTLAARAVKADPREPWGYLAAAEAARRGLDDAGETTALLAAIGARPDHALALIAAGRLVELAGIGRAVDAAIGAKLPALRADRRLPVETRFRLALAERELFLTRSEDPAPAVRAAGLLDAATMVGPFSAYHALETERSFPPERSPVQASYEGPPGIGALPLRSFAFPSGRLSFEGESRTGDVYYALSIARVERQGRHAVRLSTPRGASAEVRIDGAAVVRRDVAAGVPFPEVTAAVIDLPAGDHLIAVKVVRGFDRGAIAVSLLPLDVSAPPVAFRAAVPGDRAGKAPTVVSVDRDGGPAMGLGADGALLATLLSEGGAAGIYLAALDATSRDTEGAKELLAGLSVTLPGSAPLLALAADLAFEDPSLPGSLAQARAATVIDEAIRRDPDYARALLRSAMLLTQGGRHDDALTRVEEADVAVPNRAQVAVVRARIESNRGFDILALAAAREAERREAGVCAAGETLYDLSRQAAAAADVEATTAAYATCPRGLDRRIALLRSRGQLDEALALARQALVLEPQGIPEAFRVADLLLALGRPVEGAAVVGTLEISWPRNPGLPRRRAELLEAAGDRAGAAAARRLALALDGGDLSLRRLVAREGGREPMDDLARDGLAAIRAHERSGKKFDTRALVVLDFTAVEVYADGSGVERVHSVIQVLDKRGIDENAEVHLPPGADVLKLHTVKRDGRILEPEAFAGKESISLPGLEVGDYVETEYLLPVPARGPALPGWTASRFFFRSPDLPLLESIYIVRAGKSAGLDFDLHEVEPVERTEKDGVVTVTFRRADVPAHVGEPRAPGRSEYLPWVQAGAGVGEEAVAAYLGDTLADDAAPTREIRAFARRAVAKVSSANVEARVRAVYDAVMDAVNGNDGGWGSPASHVLARQRGNRLLLLKASLDAIGIDSRFVAVRAFEQDPREARFPAVDRWGSIVLSVPAGNKTIWLDPSLRWMPFGQLPPSLRGQPGFVLPEPGDDLAAVRRVITPTPAEIPLARETELALEVAPNGDVRGEGVERYLGVDGARARSSFENLDPDRRRQAIEAALARSFRGLVLEDLSVETDSLPLVVRYRFHAAGLVRELGDGRLVLQPGFFAANLGRRYLTRGARETPMLVAPDRGVVILRLSLPAGNKLHDLTDADIRAPFGAWTRVVRSIACGAEIREELSIERARIAPDDYPAFARWVTAVDRGQAAEAIIAP